MRKAAIFAFLLVFMLAPWPAPAEPLLAEPSSPDIDWSALDVDAAALAAKKPEWSPPPAPNVAAGASSFDRKDNPDGSAALSMKQSLPMAWDAKIGVDLGLAAPPSSTFVPDKPLSASSAQSSGAAWGSVAMPGASFDARLDPMQEQGKLGTRLSKSLPLGDTLSVTLQNGYSITNTLTNNNSALPSSGLIVSPASPGPSHVLSTDRTARLSILPTGTTFSAGAAMSSTDDKWLRSIGAEQKLFGAVSITGTISETASGAADKSIKAGLKKSW